MDITFRFSEYGPFSGYNRTVKLHDVTLDDLEVIAAFSDVVTAFMCNDSGEDDEVGFDESTVNLGDEDDGYEEDADPEEDNPVDGD